MAALLDLLQRNPNVSNNALSGVIRANNPNSKYVHVSDGKMPSLEGSEGARCKVIYMSPYGFWEDILVSIQRIFTGVMFGPYSNEDFSEHLRIGRRLTIFYSFNGLVDIRPEEDRRSLFDRIRSAIFCCNRS